jgi:pimeloyl-ACP methyl ester carboxylesterase
MASSVSWILVTSPLLWLLFASSFAAGETRQRGVPKSTAGEIMNVQATGAHLTADDTILDLLNHPAFAGFARLLLPWDDRGYDNSMRLRNIGSLLPYHSHVDPGTVVSALNHMIDDVNNGKTIFYEFYTEKEKKEQRTKSNTGLFDTGHSEYTADEPPTFVVVGERDAIAPPSVMERRVAALRRAGTEVEFHQYSGLGHGFGPGTGTSADGWLDRAVRFWERIIKSKTRRWSWIRLVQHDRIPSLKVDGRPAFSGSREVLRITSRVGVPLTDAVLRCEIRLGSLAPLFFLD